MNVTNYASGVEAARSGEHTYTVSVGRDGLPTECTCPAAKYQSGPCKHVVAVAGGRAVLDGTMHGDSDLSTDVDANQAVARRRVLRDRRTTSDAPPAYDVCEAPDSYLTLRGLLWWMKGEARFAASPLARSEVLAPLTPRGRGLRRCCAVAVAASASRPTASEAGVLVSRRRTRARKSFALPEAERADAFGPDFCE